MLEDKKRWNEKYSQKEAQENVSLILEEYVSHANVGIALDVACGTGRNTNFLAQKGFEVDAVDISNVALDKIAKRPTINKIEADLDKYNITPNKYDLIVNVNYLNRRIVSQMKDGLKKGGVIIFETYLLAHGDFKIPTMNLDYLLRKNELLHSFIALDVIYYEERIDVNPNGERVKIASIVAKKS
ncbi:MAG: methyltransferase domain-containing protein [Sulfurimonas sp.]|uniref:methyltransferase domain-containing protein n=1 Tax=Sulfurimonas sp. TaxID=2022749 RepID=UPI0025FAFDEE|nr:methyltransferase domain-containing protein [Sulfurimonas sp.]MCK9491204.1 methyltransferase domain-containing protein [Sulfurimonas sp.]